LGECLLWTVFLSATVGQFFELLFPQQNLFNNFNKNGLGIILGEFSQTIGRPAGVQHTYI
jgi:hypothetical protein